MLKVKPRPSKVLADNREAIRRIVVAHRFTNPRVFGSVLHGEDTPDSDLDILIDPLPGATLFDVGGIRADLNALLDIPFDIVTPNSLSPKFREEVLAEALPL